MAKKKHGEKKPGIVPPPRYPSGDIIKAGKELAPTLIRRIADHALTLGADQRIGSVIGLMYLRGELSERQAEAGLRYAELVGEYDRVKGIPPRGERSASYKAGFDADPLDVSRLDPEERAKAEKRRARRARRVERKYEAAQRHIPMFPIIARSVVEEVCCSDREVNAVHREGLRKILDRLAVHFRVLAPATEEQKPQRTKPRTDAKHIAEAAVDALERRFGRDTIQAFDLTRGKNDSRRIVGIGVGRDGKTAVEHMIEIPVRQKLLAATIDAQLVKAAEAKGWEQASRRRRFEHSKRRKAA
jgi:hypothetical protein